MSNYNRDAVVSIFMERDGVSREDAEILFSEAYDAVVEAIRFGNDPEEVWMNLTGLEPDYIFGLL